MMMLPEKVLEGGTKFLLKIEKNLFFGGRGGRGGWWRGPIYSKAKALT